jgi:hypothetical protein
LSPEISEQRVEGNLLVISDKRPKRAFMQSTALFFHFFLLIAKKQSNPSANPLFFPIKSPFLIAFAQSPERACMLIENRLQRSN